VTLWKDQYSATLHNTLSYNFFQHRTQSQHTFCAIQDEKTLITLLPRLESRRKAFILIKSLLSIAIAMTLRAYRSPIDPKE